MTFSFLQIISGIIGFGQVNYNFIWAGNKTFLMTITNYTLWTTRGWVAQLVTRMPPRLPRVGSCACYATLSTCVGSFSPNPLGWITKKKKKKKKGKEAMLCVPFTLLLSDGSSNMSQVKWQVIHLCHSTDFPCSPFLLP